MQESSTSEHQLLGAQTSVSLPEPPPPPPRHPLLHRKSSLTKLSKQKPQKQRQNTEKDSPQPRQHKKGAEFPIARTKSGVEGPGITILRGHAMRRERERERKGKNKEADRERRKNTWRKRACVSLPRGEKKPLGHPKS